MADTGANYIDISPSSTLEELLYRARVLDTMNTSSWEEANNSLKVINTDLTAVRNEWINRFLENKDV